MIKKSPFLFRRRKTRCDPEPSHSFSGEITQQLPLFSSKQKAPLRMRREASRALFHLRQPGYPRGTRSFASPDCSGFALIGI